MFMKIFTVIAGLASIIGLIYKGKKYMTKKENSNKQVIENGDNNQQAGRDINE